MRVDHAMILNVVNQPRRRRRGDARADGGQPRGRARARQARPSRPRRSATSSSPRASSSGCPSPTRDGRTLRLAIDLQENFALNQPLASFALAALDLLDPESEDHALDVVSVVEAILDDPFPVLRAQANKAKGEAVAEMKAEGIEYDERMELLEEVTYPKPLDEALRDAFHALPRDAPVGARVRPLAEVGRARHVRAGADVHRVRRATTGSRARRASCCAT